MFIGKSKQTEYDVVRVLLRSRNRLSSSSNSLHNVLKSRGRPVYYYNNTGLLRQGEIISSGAACVFIYAVSLFLETKVFILLSRQQIW